MCYTIGMGSDLFALNALARELDKDLKGARIDKIQQPECDELRFFLRAMGRNLCLVMSCNASNPRLHLTKNRKQSPKIAPNLCMLLRKYLTNASIDGVKIFNADRIIQIKFNAKTEMRDEAVFYIFVEIMNRYSNIVFTDENLIILDAVKHLPLDVARDHVVLRGVKYAPVGQKKISYLNGCLDIIDDYTSGDIHRYILDNVSGFGGTTVSEILYRAGIEANAQTLTKSQIEKLKDVIGNFARFGEENCNIEFRPCIIGGKDVCPTPYQCLIKNNVGNVRYFDSMSDAYDEAFTDSDKDVRNKARLKSLATISKHLRQKIEKNIATDLQKLSECDDMEKYRIFGELIVNNIYRIRRGDTQLDCLNYYTNEDVSIPLDARLTPSRNSTAYYNKYNKLKRTKEFVSQKLVDDRELLEYVLSIEDEIANLPYECDSSSIEEELNMLGGGKKKSTKGKVRKEKAEPPYIYLVDGFYIYRGKNNLQNDELTFKIASSNDIWLHLKNEHGAHTVIITEGRKVPDKVLKIACEITASTKSANCDVDYTERRNVKRKPNSHPGQVIYVGFKTALSTPDAHEEFLIKK